MKRDYLELVQEQMRNILEAARARNDLRHPDALEGLEAGHPALLLHTNDGETADPVPANRRGNAEQWPIRGIVEELEQFNSEGKDAITSIPEAHTKATAIFRRWAAPRYGPVKKYYRGHSDSAWKLVPTIGRDDLKDQFPLNGAAHTATAEEIDALRDFQRRVRSGEVEIHDLRGALPDDEDPAWWPLAKHNGGDTRLLDVTTSIESGLYFACINFDGKIDPDTDGMLYCFGSKVMPHDENNNTVESFFDSPMNRLTHLRAHKPIVRDGRMWAQDGYFLWHPNFRNPQTPQTVTFRIPGHCKWDIVRELFSADYDPRRMVRGADGETQYRLILRELERRGIPV